jgi:hypothetical protein
MNIRLYIERLILDGLPATSVRGPQVKAAVEAELTRLLTANGLSRELEGGGAVQGLSASPLRLSPETKPAQLGKQIAQSVYGGIGKTK